MKIKVSLPIRAEKDDIWNTITNIAHADQFISGIKNIDILENPDSGLLGLKWRETRVMFGKEATETMTISQVEEGQFYETISENHGMIYRSRMSLQSGENKDAATNLTMSFKSEPKTWTARVLGGLMGMMMQRSMKKMMLQDLIDIRGHLNKVP